MYYISFDIDGNQEQAKWFDGVLPDEDGWYMASEDISGKRYKLDGQEAVEMTEEEISAYLDSTFLKSSMIGIKAERNRRLLESDWTVSPEVPMTEEKKNAWASYRQALRDFPSTITVDFLKSGADLQWPALPS